MEMEETKIGRLAHKIEKLKTLGERTPGVEFMRSEVFSGDHGLAVIEHAPFGVIGAITPVTHSLPTITGNAVSMIAGGNTLVVNPHPSGKRVAAEGVRRFNEAIYRDLGIDNLICVIAEPTLETADADLQPSRHQADLRHRRTGRRPGRHEQRQAGDRRRAGQSAGRRRRNGRSGSRRPVDHSGRRLRQQPAVHRREGSLRRRRGLRRRCWPRWSGPAPCGSTAREVDALTKVAITTVGEGEHKHDVPAKDFLGQDAAVLARGIGKQVPADDRAAVRRNRRDRTRSCRSSR